MDHFFPADILLPKKDFFRWAVIACDQYTSEPHYWQEVGKIVGDAPSALKIMLPEIYLEDNPQERIEKINQTMEAYLADDVLQCYPQSMIYVERTQADGKIVRGIVGAIDLNEYDYHAHAHSLVRSTEKTIESRLPSRVAIRQNASLEMPHILLLMADPLFQVIQPLSEEKERFKCLYDFELMLNGGHLKGYLLDEKTVKTVQEALNELIAQQDEPLLFAVGDGNHSLAAAKECANLNASPLAQQALVEIVNIHDEAIQFEPIYRVLFNCESQKVLADLKAALAVDTNEQSGHHIRYVATDISGEVFLKTTSNLPIGTLQNWLDAYLADKPEITVDYIHGVEAVEKICQAPNTLGFIFDSIDKDELFSAVAKEGSLPRKTFSMGHASDKRYYMECRKIK